MPSTADVNGREVKLVDCLPGRLRVASNGTLSCVYLEIVVWTVGV